MHKFFCILGKCFERAYFRLAVIYTALSLIVIHIYSPVPDWSFLSDIVYDFGFVQIVAIFVYTYIPFLAFSMWYSGQDSQLCGPEWRRELRENYLTSEKALDLALVLISIKTVLVMHTTLKQAIPVLNSNLYDTDLLHIDKVLHFGYDPNEKLSALFSTSPSSVCLMDFFYFFWFYLKGMMTAIFVITKDRVLHCRYFFAFFSLWIFGGLLAIYFPSLGPIYVHPDWYANLNAPVAQFFQKQLYLGYLTQLKSDSPMNFHLYEGIAAFPSLHVGVAALYLFEAFPLNRILTIALFAYLVIIQIASVVLGWHYAVDGYAGILIAWLCYRLAIKVVPNGAIKA